MILDWRSADFKAGYILFSALLMTAWLCLKLEVGLVSSMAASTVAGKRMIHHRFRFIQGFLVRPMDSVLKL